MPVFKKFAHSHHLQTSVHSQGGSPTFGRKDNARMQAVPRGNIFSRVRPFYESFSL
jgi:hypothetical protein